MVHVQKWNGKETSLVREVSGNALTLVSARTKCARTRCTCMCVCVCCILTVALSPITDTHTRRSHLHAWLREGRVNPNTKSLQRLQYLCQLKPCTSNSLTPPQPRPSKPLVWLLPIPLNVPSYCMFSIKITADCDLPFLPVLLFILLFLLL